MSGVHIDIDDSEVQFWFHKVQHSVEHPQSFYADIGEMLLNSNRMRQEQEVDPDGNQWKALSPAYAEWKQSHGKSLKKLVKDNFMLANISYDATDEGLSLGINTIYAATQHFGDKQRNIPARPFLGISEQDAEEIVWICKDWLGLT